MWRKGEERFLADAPQKRRHHNKAVWKTYRRNTESVYRYKKYANKYKKIDSNGKNYKKMHKIYTI